MGNETYTGVSYADWLRDLKVGDTIKIHPSGAICNISSEVPVYNALAWAVLDDNNNVFYFDKGNGRELGRREGVYGKKAILQATPYDIDKVKRGQEVVFRQRKARDLYEKVRRLTKMRYGVALVPEGVSVYQLADLPDTQTSLQQLVYELEGTHELT